MAAGKSWDRRSVESFRCASSQDTIEQAHRKAAKKAAKREAAKELDKKEKKAKAVAASRSFAFACAIGGQWGWGSTEVGRSVAFETTPIVADCRRLSRSPLAVCDILAHQHDSCRHSFSPR